ncbi:EF hand family protein [Trichomonas vaginalis G3]|uniref:EF hand family protein n=1 Tax=Trichomonas vaginalis (strain ATCC PRA-98 / G3) TaxID=412133 RepID=A2FET7_TRIV3|nr:calcium ion binding [Trichomonas vaginalis G3]EAX96584.1 EF hand family protein [Trichomonas vaginalis G3]KAI5485910.1 calcium ion binding [Trichomonas vaginalis G3]|eukprot:XP_001309514.1 EF hand family protein [Trichomonas vaginalis G3]
MAKNTCIFTPAQLQEFKQQFEDLDADGDGKLDREEVGEILQWEASYVDRLMVVLLFEKYDRNKDGVISFDEFLDFCEHACSRDQDLLLREIFAICDVDHNQQLDLNEVICLGKLMGVDVTKNDAIATIDSLDRNRDKVINITEFLSILHQ